MPRGARRKSQSGIYHVMLRGINKQSIFESDGDRERLLETIDRYKPLSEFELYGYCLMDNHIHLLIKETDEPVSKAIQRISCSYVYWYNNKYERVGPLFQGRYKSENVEDQSYFLTVLRYIHQNPMKAGIAADVFTSSWTSIHAYYNPTSLIDGDMPLALYSPDRQKAIQLFTEYMTETNEDICMPDNRKTKMTDDEEIRLSLKEKGIKSNSALQQMTREKRNAILSELKNIEGTTIRQLSRITGVSKSVIQRIR